MIIFWIIIFTVSLVVMVKGADWLLESSEKIGLAAGITPFIVGVVIVGLGTSFPEVISSLFAVFAGATEIVPAAVIGSNIANVLLAIGISALIARKLVVSKNLIDLDLPLLASGTVLFLGVIWDKQVTFVEALLLLVTYTVYLLYTILHKDEDILERAPAAMVLKKEKLKKVPKPVKIQPRDIGILLLGVFSLLIGAKYLIDSVINIANLLAIGTGVIALTAVALGTSLPEILVSVRAATKRKFDVALGNIFGSNIFNMFMVIGIPGLFSRLVVDDQTFAVGVPALALVTLLFIISGISRRIYMWEGTFYLAIYILFIAKLFNIF